MNSNTNNFLEFLCEHLRRSPYHIFLGNVLLGNRDNTVFAVLIKKADIVFSLRLLGLYGFSLINEGNVPLPKALF